MTAGRLYVVQHWNNASAYSGEQIGTRLAQSEVLHFNRDGTANTSLYDDEKWEKEKAAKRQRKQKSPREILLPYSIKIEGFNKLEERIDLQFGQGEITVDQYSELICALYLQKEQAFKRHLQSIGQYDQWIDDLIGNNKSTDKAPTNEVSEWTSYEKSNAELYAMACLAIIILLVQIRC